LQTTKNINIKTGQAREVSRERTKKGGTARKRTTANDLERSEVDDGPGGVGQQMEGCASGYSTRRQRTGNADRKRMLLGRGNERVGSELLD